MNDNNMTGGQRLQALVLRLELTIRELANIANMSEATFYHITDGTRGISERVASRVCYNLEKKRGVTVNRQWLLTGEGEMMEGDINTVAKRIVAEPAKMVYAHPQEALSRADAAEPDGTDWKEKYYTLLEQYNNLYGRYVAMLERMQQ